MATIVEFTGNGQNYILLDSGFGAYRSTKPNAIFGNWVSDTEAGHEAMACLCDHTGQIGWVESAAVRVISVDGVPVGNLL